MHLAFDPPLPAGVGVTSVFPILRDVAEREFGDDLREREFE
ncbi:hypothetical protein Halar_3703 [halophilic archaeon DL31]|jgi:hypothetical protein|nr:hypothetical protein Halar_3703 [halophilic archaeon DL31]